jgi:hypothetical protein
MGWTFVWLMVVLKIPIIALFWLVYWSVKQAPDGVEDQGEGGSKKPVEPKLDPPKRPRRRGPHGDPALPAPPRARKPVKARGRELKR